MLPKIADFGLGRADRPRADASAQASQGIVVGTTMYLPPEALQPLVLKPDRLQLRPGVSAVARVPRERHKAQQDNRQKNREHRYADGKRRQKEAGIHSGSLRCQC